MEKLYKLPLSEADKAEIQRETELYIEKRGEVEDFIKQGNPSEYEAQVAIGDCWDTLVLTKEHDVADTLAKAYSEKGFTTRVLTFWSMKVMQAGEPIRPKKAQ